jgi:UDP-2-acetamido-2-deoxy-ribo-hexuluronate aminotransferase
MHIEMVDLKNQYIKINNEINASLLKVLTDANFINGPEVQIFSNNLSRYLDNTNVITCANGTDALQIALMSLNLKKGDEVIIPAFTYVATAEVIGLLGLKPVLIDVNSNTFNIDVNEIIKAITPKTKAIVPVHLFGQCADMEPILKIANDYKLYVIEDAAQALGAEYQFSNGEKRKAGTMGTIGCTSFFPTKNLGCYGDGGAIFTNDNLLKIKIQQIANHGQEKKYVHKYIGVNSRLDTIQASILDIKLKSLNKYNLSRIQSAEIYQSLLKNVNGIQLPSITTNSSHVFHQYTIKVKNNLRDDLKKHLEDFGIPTMIYYPIPLNKQEAYSKITKIIGNLNDTENLCNEVLSLPMHTELSKEQLSFISQKIINFFN